MGPIFKSFKFGCGSGLNKGFLFLVLLVPPKDYELNKSLVMI